MRNIIIVALLIVLGIAHAIIGICSYKMMVWPSGSIAEKICFGTLFSIACGVPYSVMLLYVWEKL